MRQNPHTERDKKEMIALKEQEEKSSKTKNDLSEGGCEYISSNAPIPTFPNASLLTADIPKESREQSPDCSVESPHSRSITGPVPPEDIHPIVVWDPHWSRGHSPDCNEGSTRSQSPTGPIPPEDYYRPKSSRGQSLDCNVGSPPIPRTVARL